MQADWYGSWIYSLSVKIMHFKVKYNTNSNNIIFKSVWNLNDQNIKIMIINS